MKIYSLANLFLRLLFVVWGLGWVWVDDTDPWTTLRHIIQTCCAADAHDSLAYITAPLQLCGARFIQPLIATDCVDTDHTVVFNVNCQRPLIHTA